MSKHAQTDFTPDAANLDCPFLAHEALDRTHLILSMLSDHLAEHPYIAANVVLSALVQDSIDALSSAYQAIGAKQ